MPWIDRSADRYTRRMNRRAAPPLQLLSAALFSVALVAGAAEPTADDFSGARAMAHLEGLVGLGPRPSGSPGMARQRQLLSDHFRAAGATVVPQRFRGRDPRTGQSIEMENLIVEWHADRKDRILLAAHYDTRPFPDRDPVDPRGVFVGANDGASGVAVLMELARWMPALEGPVGVDFVCFDAEECVVSPRDPYFLGSRHFAREYLAGRPVGTDVRRYRCGVLLDMVGDADLAIWQEQYSVEWDDTRPVVESLWGVAARLGVRQFVPRPRYRVDDDHVPLRNIARIPTCDVIDFDYPHWHTTEDVAARCSAESLGAVGRVVLTWLREQR